MNQHLKNIGSGFLGIGVIDTLDAQTTNELINVVSEPTQDTQSTLIKVVVAIISIIPSILSLFKRKKQ